MILNYRVELCRKCYYKRTQQCLSTDDYINNSNDFLTKPGGECLHYRPVPWVPRPPLQ
ncbi:hypothetical protein Desaci_3137 [Desulfosporosinus acidiphilus SJ4]|uniref:Uncharacterized protein n=1 Tax=Desulfosporosinus acidiphilus (strain DSM 22704 / JCM 16185 / SJ4) TaxID=646529 RepID=I4D8B7_DESAJ|nr:hypothetical protein Desaci_3137 [Desulfosporosinus acidiphilus SJ4]